MNENNNLATNVAENAEQPAEQTQQAEKIYTQADVDAIVGKSKAIAKAKIQKEMDRKYGDLIDTLKAGMGEEEDDVGKITGKLRTFYEDQGVEMPQKSAYTASDLEILAKAEADEYIRAGFEEVVEEVDRLADIGAANMTDREKAVFKVLAEHRAKTEKSNELAKIGVPADVYNSADFQNFAAKFNSNIPITEVYGYYTKNQPKQEFKTMGSMTNNTADNGGVKDYYSFEEASKFTKEDFDKNPELFKAVQASMLKW